MRVENLQRNEYSDIDNDKKSGPQRTLEELQQWSPHCPSDLYARLGERRRQNSGAKHRDQASDLIYISPPGLSAKRWRSGEWAYLSSSPTRLEVVPTHNFEHPAAHIQSFRHPRKDMSAHEKASSIIAHRIECQVRRRVTCVQVSESEYLASHSEKRATRSEEHTSELQSPDHLVCRLLL